MERLLGPGCTIHPTPSSRRTFQRGDRSAPPCRSASSRHERTARRALFRFSPVRENDELLGIGTKLIEVLGHKAEYLVRNCLGTVEDACWGAAPTRLVPLNLLIEPLEHARDVLAIERFVAFPNRLHVLLRHGASRGGNHTPRELTTSWIGCPRARPLRSGP